MKKKQIVLLLIITFVLSITGTVGTSIFSSARELPTLVEGHYERTYQELFENHLMVDSMGLSVLGVHTLPGQVTKTDLLVVGTDRNAGMYAVQGYFPNMTHHLPVDYHSDNTPPYDADIVRDMVKFLNPISGNMEVVYVEGNWYDDDGKIVKQDFVNPTKSDGALVPEWTISTSEQMIALTLGDFDSNAADLEVAALCMDGDVYVVNNIQSSSPSYWKHDLDAYTWYDFRNDHVKSPITAIGDLDGNNPTQDDIVFAWYGNVSAISTNSSNREIWNVDVHIYISDVLAVDDINSDGKQDVVATSSGGVYLLSGADGSILAQIAEPNSYYRDVELYNSTAVITGNKDGDIIVWDIFTASPTFGDVLLTTNWNGRDIYDILDVGDIDSDGVNDFAIGAESSVGVIYGNNMTKIWSKAPYGAWLAPAYIDIFDMDLIEDLNGDGIGDLAITGYAPNGGTQEGAVFVFSTYGTLQFIPDLTGSGYVDSDCEDASYTFKFTAHAYQSKNVPITTAKLIVDGTEILLTTDDTDWAGGVTYEYYSSFGDGTHTFNFYFEDDHANTYQTGQQTFQVGNCGNGGLEIPGARIWMILSSLALGIVLSFLVYKKRLNH